MWWADWLHFRDYEECLQGVFEQAFINMLGRHQQIATALYLQDVCNIVVHGSRLLIPRTLEFSG